MIEHLVKNLSYHRGRHGWVLQDLVAWVLAGLTVVGAFMVGTHYLGYQDPYRIHVLILTALFALQVLVVCFAYVARVHSTWRSGVYEWLVAGSAIYFVHSALTFWLEFGGDASLQPYANMALLLSMGCFLAASLRVSGLARRYGFLSMGWSEKGMRGEPDEFEVNERVDRTKKKSKPRRSRRSEG